MKFENFRTEDGKLVDVFSYSKSMLSKYPGVLKIHIGCDSQNKKHDTIYVTVLAYRFGNRGVHYIFIREHIGKIKDKWSRLWGETERVAELGVALRNNGIPVHFVELDYNGKDVNSGSHMMVAPGVGYMKGLGFMNVITKPDDQLAVKAADHLVN